MSTGKKIPGECPVCSKPLTQADMEGFLRVCEKSGCDPIERAFETNPPGVVCSDCMLRIVADGVETGEPAAQRLLAKMRRFYLGVDELPDGKPIVWH